MSAEGKELEEINYMLTEARNGLHELSVRRQEIARDLKDNPSKDMKESLEIDRVDLSDERVRLENQIKHLEKQQTELSFFIRDLDVDDDPPTDSDDEQKQPPPTKPTSTLDDLFYDDDASPTPGHLGIDMRDEEPDDEEEHKHMSLEDVEFNCTRLYSEFEEQIGEAMSNATYKKDGNLTAKSIKRLTILHNKKRKRVEAQLTEIIDSAEWIPQEYVDGLVASLNHIRTILGEFIG